MMTTVEKISKLGWLWLAGIGIAFALYWCLSYFNAATILFPRNDEILELVLWAGVAFSFGSALVGFKCARGPIVPRLILSILGYGLGGGISSALLFATLSEIIQNRVYFPASKTQTFSGIVPVKRAYVGHSRTCKAENTCWNVQTMQLWSNLNIFEDDYKFMLENPNLSDTGRDPEEISSYGYHCLYVKMQKAGEAVRILQAGSFTLPKGSVMRCPQREMSEITMTPISSANDR